MNLNIKKTASLLSIAIALGSAGTVFAGEKLNASKVKTVVVGKTFYAKHLVKGIKFKVYFDADGKTAYRTTKEGVVKTTYKFEGNKHCIEWQGKTHCSVIVDNGDGTYARLNNGKPVVEWYKVVEGKDV